MRHRNYKCIAKTIYNKKQSLRKSPFLEKQHITVLCVVGHRNKKRRPDTESGDRAGYSFVPNRDPPDTPQQSSSVRSCIIIHQNEVVTNSSSIWADIWIKDLIPISKTSYGSSMEHMQVQCGHRARSPAQTRIPPPL
ncbi:hypothetical protein TNCV_1898611 [Trichonephila clavipes]|nr:hypothetical protein TNCV_1898611 [Trichonephila clavipes]